MRNSQDAAATAWAGIRPDKACTTPCNPSPRDTNEMRRPQDVSALAAEVAESTGNSVPSNERPPPSAATSVEPRCTWNGGAVAAQARRANVSATFADEQVPRGWELSGRALDPYAYALRMAHDSPVRDATSGARGRHETRCAALHGAAKL
ncbi:hypothetical protein HPB50_015530 [Hyalomma asiaticum]|uniref:Uncharacterized protein n=1 Tax=Hyalomma asiaticum TaxID=266040 RepID=A0ACB7S0L2_HYAAI|nr:hypothetical protein HPB50_015530 [Hyalomma asiaticum]